jgi:hypothetical protein
VTGPDLGAWEPPTGLLADYVSRMQPEQVALAPQVIATLFAAEHARVTEPAAS